MFFYSSNVLASGRQREAKNLPQTHSKLALIRQVGLTKQQYSTVALRQLRIKDLLLVVGLSVINVKRLITTVLVRLQSLRIKSCT